MPSLVTDISTASITYAVSLGGQTLTGENGVVSIMVEKVYNRIASAEIVFLDGNVEEQNFNLSNQSYTIPGQAIEISCGYDDNVKTIFKGIVVSHSIKVRNRKSQLIIYAKDKSVSMALSKKNNYFLAARDADVINQIITGAGLIPEVDNTIIIHDQLVQAQTSDWDFLVQRAEANGMLVSTEDGTVKVKKPSLFNISLLTATYGQNIVEFDAEIDGRNQVEKVTAIGWDHDGLSVLSEESTDPVLNRQGNTDASQIASAVNAGEWKQLHGGIHNENELKEWANARLLKSRLSKIVGRVRIVGTADVALGQLITLNGVGERFNGQVLVSGARHELIRGGWYTDIQFGLPAKWHAEEYVTCGNEAANISPVINGLHIGIVTKLEGDPESNARIKVKLPLVNDTEEGVWARVSKLDAGENRGTVIYPEIGDEVIVGFIQNDPRFAVVLGMMHSKKNTVPQDLEAKDDNHKKGWVTRSEMKMIFDDEKKIFTISTPGEYLFTIDEDQKIINLKDKKGNFIKMSEDGIEINSAKDIIMKAANDIKMEGVNMEQKASSSWKANASGTGELKSSGSLTVKGTTVMIN